MLSEEEKKAIEMIEIIVDECKLENKRKGYKGTYYDGDTPIPYKEYEIVLNLITKLQKENEEKDKEIKELKQNIDYQVLCDFLISSVSNEEPPIWTEKHIEELLENFEMRWKNAYK